MANDNTLTILSEAPTDPTVSSGIAPSNSIQNTVIKNSPDYFDLTHKDTDNADDAWAGCPWGKYKQYRKPDYSKCGYMSWIWNEGYRLQNINNGKILWICKKCLQQKHSPPAEYQAKGGTANMSDHLRDKHLI